VRQFQKANSDEAAHPRPATGAACCNSGGQLGLEGLVLAKIARVELPGCVVCESRRVGEGIVARERHRVTGRHIEFQRSKAGVRDVDSVACCRGAR
jgi:hypothetical protein